MNKKWLLTLSGSLLAAMIVTGCADDQDPAPPEDNMEEVPPAEENGDTGNGTENNMEDEIEQDMEQGKNETEEGMNDAGEEMEEGMNEAEEGMDEGLKDEEEKKE